jgi:hypothetical protein
MPKYLITGASGFLGYHLVSLDDGSCPSFSTPSVESCI